MHQIAFEMFIYPFSYQMCILGGKLDKRFIIVCNKISILIINYSFGGNILLEIVFTLQATCM